MELIIIIVVKNAIDFVNVDMMMNVILFNKIVKVYVNMDLHIVSYVINVIDHVKWKINIIKVVLIVMIFVVIKKNIVNHVNSVIDYVKIRIKKIRIYIVTVNKNVNMINIIMKLVLIVKDIYLKI